MHIVDGALSTEVVIAGAALTLGGTALGLRQLPLERIPAAGVLAAAFFVASLIRVPAGPSSVHLVLNGLSGLVLGWAVFPALLAGLLMQAAFFGFGGLTALGVNAFIIAGPAVAVHMLLRPFIARTTPKRAAIFGGIAGAVAIAMTAVLVAVALVLSGDAFIAAAKFVLVTHIPIMVVEALLTAAAVYLISTVKPELFQKADRP